MREEYDFSNGRRNRYADRLRDQSLSTPTTRGEQPPTGIVQVFKGSDGAYRWRLELPDGEVLANSAESFPTQIQCRQAVEQFLRATAWPATIDAA